MIRVSVMYPKQDGGEFNYDYYLQTHMPLVKERLGDALKKWKFIKVSVEPETHRKPMLQWQIYI